MQTIDFVVHSDMGVVQRSAVSPSSGDNTVYVGAGQEVSMNLSQHQIAGYERDGSNLVITLSDGNQIVLSNYFNADDARVFISSGGILTEVAFADEQEGVLYATYQDASGWGKWSPAEDLYFYNEPAPLGLAEAAPVAADYASEEVSMLGAGMLLAPSLLNAGAVAGTLLGGAVVVDAMTNGGGGNGGATASPDPDVDPTVITGDQSMGGDDLDESDEVVTIEGTGEPGAEVEVVINGNTETTTVDPDGNWTVDFEGDTFPGDGSHEVDVTVTDPDGEVTELEGPEVVIDTTPPVVEVESGTDSTGDSFNETVHTASGVTITGTSEPGAAIEVVIDGHTQTTTVDENGNWSVNFGTDQLGGGEYTTEATITATDSFGNSASYTETVVVDTQTSVALDTGLSGGDNTVNNTEAGGEVAITGTAQPNSNVVVTVNGTDYATTTDANGVWTVGVAAGSLAGGEYDLPISVTSTDAYNNTATTQGTVRVDTVTNVDVDTEATGQDGTINAAESDQSTFELTGTTEPGSSVMVTVGGMTLPATVAADGTWTLDVPTSVIPNGNVETGLPVTAVATDAAGNQSVTTGTVDIDTYVNQLTADDLVSGNDNVVNTEEMANGLVLGGLVEPGSEVSVVFGGQTYAATVDQNGNWTVTIPKEDVGEIDDTVGYTVVATDEAGNVASTNETVRIDTIIPEGPTIFEEGTRILENTGGEDDTILTRLYVQDMGEDVDVVTISDSGEVYSPSQQDFDIAGDFSASGLDEIEIRIASSERILDGTTLVITGQDDAGNSASTLLAWDQTGSLSIDFDDVVDANLNVEKIDLRLAKEAEVSLTEEQVLGLSQDENSVTIFGGSDDTVTLTGAVHTGTQTDSEGNSYNVYTLGDDATVLVDDHIDNVII